MYYSNRRHKIVTLVYVGTMNKTQILRVDLNVSTKLLSWDSPGTRTVLKGSFASYGKDFWKKKK